MYLTLLVAFGLEYIHLASYSLVLDKRPPLLDNFRKFFLLPGSYLDPPLIKVENFQFQQLWNIQKYTINRVFWLTFVCQCYIGVENE